MTHIKENIITKLKKLYSPPRPIRAGNKLPALFLRKPLYMGDLSPACKIFIERPATPSQSKGSIVNKWATMKNL